MIQPKKQLQNSNEMAETLASLNSEKTKM